MHVTAIIAAAGQSTRFGHGNKLEQDLGGRPVLLRSFEALANRHEVRQLLVAVDPDRFDDVRMRFGDAVAIRGGRIIPGGRTARWETIQLALAEVDAEATHVAIHDGARPCINQQLLDRLFEAANLFDAVIPGIPVPDTLKRVSEETVAAATDDAIASAILGDAGAEQQTARIVSETIDRRHVVAVQTPQIFSVEMLQRAYAQDNLESTDDAMLIERLGERVHVVEGDRTNLKITTPDDLQLARLILKVPPTEDTPAHLRF